MISWHRFTKGQLALLLGWILLLQAAFGAVGFYAHALLGGEQHAQQALYRIRMTPGLAEPGDIPPDPIPETGGFTPVAVGISLEDVQTMSIRDSYWTATFFVWFRWHGDEALSPGQHFQIVGGSIEKRDTVDEYYGADGTNYQQYRVTARIGQGFHTSRVPLDEQMLKIDIEDLRADAGRLRYVADPPSNVSPRVVIAGYDVRRFDQVVKTHTYRSSYGDPRDHGSASATFSQYRYAVIAERNGMGVYFKVFIGLFAGLALALSSLTLRGSELSPRFAMMSGAYFGAVANSYLAGSLLPSSGEFGLAECVTLTGLFTIFMTVAATSLSAHIWAERGNHALSRAFDFASLFALGTGYIVVTVVITRSV